MNAQDKDGLTGLIMWALIGAIIALLYTMNRWLAAVHATDQPAFWVNVGVAVGTLALAAVTWWNVKVTRSVISAEDRRLQQSLAPLLLVQLVLNEDMLPNEILRDFNGFRLTNHGRGLARDINLEVEFFTLVYARIGERRPGVPRTIVKQRATEDPIEANDNFDALVEHESVITRLGLESDDIADVTMTDFSSIRISYFDMFGNRYETVYDGLFRYRWIRPKHLEIPGAPPSG